MHKKPPSVRGLDRSEESGVNHLPAPVVHPEPVLWSTDSQPVVSQTASAPPATSQRFENRLAFSVQEAAELLGVSSKSIRRLIARRLLRPSRALRHLLIPKTEILRFLKETSI